MAARRRRQKSANPAAEPAKEHPWRNRAGWGALILVLGVTFFTTLYPGVTKGDSAELQYMCPLLGVCHPPGYAVEVVVGNLFSRLPIGSSVAWRINLMQAVCGVLGALALYGALRRLTGQILPALVATTTLAFSTIYWQHCSRAEVYAFYGMFLLAGIYASVRFLTSDKVGWLLLTAFFLGVSVGGRPSEALVLPAFVGLWWGFRQRVRLSAGRIAAAVMIAVSPFVFSVCFHVSREDPALLHSRDDAYRDEVLGKGTPLGQLSLAGQLRQALLYTTGLKGAGQDEFTTFSWERVGWDLNKYAWQLSGLGGFGDRFPHTDPEVDPDLHLKRREQGRGTSIGVLGVLLALAGLRWWRKQRGAVLLGLGLFLGNLVYYAYMHPLDNLDFTIPGLAGLAVLIGLGVAIRTDGVIGRGHLALQIACLVVPAFLLVSNYRVVNPRTPDTREHLDLCERVKKTPLPARAVIVATYSRAHTLRNAYWVEAGRTSVRVFVFRERYKMEDLMRMVTALQSAGHTVLFSTEAITKEKTKRALAMGTPRQLVEIGLFWAHPPRQRPSPSMETEPE